MEHPSIRLRSRHPIKRHEVPEEPTERLWKKPWDIVETRNKALVTDPTIKVPGWDFTRAQWTTLNRIRTEQGRSNYLQHKWGISDTQQCECGYKQTINHIAQTCPNTKFERGLSKLHEGSPAAAKW